MYSFKLRFFAPPGFSLTPAEQEINLPDAPTVACLRQLPPRSNALPIDPVVWVIEADGFHSADAAYQFGQTLKRSLAICSARLRLGLDLGNDRATSSLGRSVREQLRRDTGVDVRPTIHGLDVFDSSVPVKHLDASARGSLMRSVGSLASDLLPDFPCPALSPKVELALELFNGCSYESDSEVRFLSLVTVVEALAVRERRGKCEREFIDSCVQRLEESTNLSAPVRKTMKDGLGNLRRESITQACLALVRRAGADVDLFRRVYKARSELLHDGVSHTYPDVPHQVDALDELVQKVLLDQVARTREPTMAGLETEPSEALRARVQRRAYFLWKDRTGTSWWNADSNWLEAECAEYSHTGLVD